MAKVCFDTHADVVLIDSHWIKLVLLNVMHIFFDQLRQFIKKHWHGLVLVSAAAVCTAIVFGFILRLESRYFERNVYFYDAAYYQEYNLEVLDRVQEEGRLAVALDEWLDNGRHPLRTVPLILLYPDLLGRQLGYLAMLIPLFFFLEALFGYTIYRRNQSLLVALGGVMLLSAVPFYYNVNFGMGAYWLEWGAYLWLGLAVLSLWNASSSRKPLYWFIGFGLTASAAFLSRYVAGMAVLFVCTPVLLWTNWQLKHQHYSWKQLVRMNGAAFICLAVFAGYFLMAHLSDNANFYNTFGYSLKHPWQEALKSMSSSWWQLWHISDLSINLFGWFMFVLFVVQGCVLIRYRTHIIELGIVTLSLVSVPVFLIMIGTVGASQSLIYGIVPTLFAVMTPVATPHFKNKFRYYNIIIGASCIILTLFVYKSTLTDLQLRTEQSPTVEKISVVGLANHLATVPGQPTTWQAFFEEYSDIPTLELYYQHHRYLRPAGQLLFHSHLTGWQGDYPGMTDQQIADSVYTQMLDSVDVAVVLADPAAADTSFWMSNQTTRVVAGSIARRIQTDPNFEPVFTYRFDFFGYDLVGYRNLKRVASKTP